MGVSWVLECCKCKKAENILNELGHYDPAEALEASFYLHKIEEGNVPQNAVILIAWIEKHKKHGGIKFDGYA